MVCRYEPHHKHFPITVPCSALFSHWAGFAFDRGGPVLDTLRGKAFPKMCCSEDVYFPLGDQACNHPAGWKVYAGNGSSCLVSRVTFGTGWRHISRTGAPNASCGTWWCHISQARSIQRLWWHQGVPQYLDRVTQGNKAGNVRLSFPAPMSGMWRVNRKRSHYLMRLG